MKTYAVLGLSSNSIGAAARSLNRDALLAIDRLARNQVGSAKKVFLAATSDEDALVTMRLDNDLLAGLNALRLGLAATTAASMN